MTEDPQKRCLEPLVGSLGLRVLHLRRSSCEIYYWDMKRDILRELWQRQGCLGYMNLKQNDQWDDTSCHTSRSGGSKNINLDDCTDGCSSCSTVLDVSGGEAIMIGSSQDYEQAKDFLAFADWAFGRHGLPSLEILAYGDFSFGARNAQQQFLLRRATPSNGSLTGLGQVRLDKMCHGHAENAPLYCMMSDADKDVWDLAEVSETVLGSCPAEDLLAFPDRF